jgi:hypothetical protein
VANLFRLTFALSALFAVVFLAAMLQPELAGDLGLSPVDLGTFLSNLSQSTKDLEPDEQNRAFLARIQEKNEVVRDLLADKITMDEAVNAFRRLDELHPVEDHAPAIFGATEEERACRKVLSWAKSRACQCPPDEAARITDRVEDQARRYLEKPVTAHRADTAEREHVPHPDTAE